MSQVQVEFCDGCSSTIDRNSDGNKVVMGCIGHNPPGALFHYCPVCKVPDVFNLAQIKHYYLIHSIEVSSGDEWFAQWTGAVMYNPKTKQFTNGYETVIERT